MKVVEIHKKKINTVPKEKCEEMIKKLRKEHEKLVKGMFEFTDAQGGWLDFSYRYFPGDPLMTFHFVHGEITEIPMGIVKHLNNTYKKVRQMPRELVEGKGSMLKGPVEKTSRVRFIPMDML